MNEIQAVKTAKIEEVKKNSKKGFTLVELVVVIAILAILAAIAIPVVSSTIASSQRSSALSNAQTLELALKEAHAQAVAKDTSVYADGLATKLSDIVKTKAIHMEEQVTISGTKYDLCWSIKDSKCYYIKNSATLTSVTAADNLDTSVAPSTDGIKLDLDASGTQVLSDLFK